MTPETVDPTENTAPVPKPRKAKPARKPRVQSAAVTNPEETITLTQAQLDQLLARVAGTSVGAPPAVTGSDFLGAVKEIIKETRPPEKITVANRIAHNPMNPDNDKRAWKKPFYQNFDPIDVEDVTPLEYELIPQLKPGLFIKSRKGEPMVEVIHVKRGAHRGIHLRYDNSKRDRAMELQTYAPTLEIMLQKCLAEFAKQQEALQARRAAGLPDEDDE